MSSYQDFMRRTLAPGQTIVIGGRRGEGKTHAAISLVQNAMEGKYGLDRPVVCITNVVFGYRTGKSNPVERYPDGVYHEDTLADTLRRTGHILSEYGPNNVTVLWVLDEAQNFMLSDVNASAENLALTRFLGNARKFALCNLFLTPALNNLTPRVRNFPTGDTKSGYCSCQMIKDKAAAARIRNEGRGIIFYRESAGAEWAPMIIASGSWTKGLYGIDTPGYSYDTLSTATFSIGENQQGKPFDLGAFIKATSSGLSHEVPARITEWFEKWDAAGLDDGLPGEDPVQIHIRTQAERIHRMRTLEFTDRRGKCIDMTWPIIAAIEGEPKTTIEGRYKKWKGSSDVRTASNRTDDETEASAARVNIKPYKEGDEGGISS